MKVTLELDGTWSGRPPTPDEHRAIERLQQTMNIDTMGWNRLLWRPPLQGNSLLIKPACTTCATQGLPILISGAQLLTATETTLRAQLERLGTHECRRAAQTGS